MRFWCLRMIDAYVWGTKFRNLDFWSWKILIFNNNNFDYSCNKMNGIIMSITNNSQNIINHLIKWYLRKFQLSNIKRGLKGFKISIIKRIMQKRMSSRVTFSDSYGYVAFLWCACNVFETTFIKRVSIKMSFF